MKLILASQSPRRRQLLDQIGVSYQVMAADIDETPHTNEGAVDYVRRMASEKAQKVAPDYPTTAVLAADTAVIIDNNILGKPKDRSHATAMLQQLSGSCHQVLSAVCVGSYTLEQGWKQQLIHVATDVHMRSLDDVEIAEYIATGEGEDKAGGYAIQGMGAILVAAMNGSYSNVVGLPLTETANILRQWHVPVWQPNELSGAT